MDYDFGWIEDIGLDTKSGMEYTGGRDKYISALQRFYKNHEKNSNKIKDFLRDKDYDNYMITVHALKSNAKMIGATELYGKFEKLEMAAREGEYDVISSDTQAVVSEYGELMEKLAPIGEIGEFFAADEITGEQALKIADQLLEALDEFDDDLSKELIVKLGGYPFRTTQKEILNKAKELVEDFMYDDAADMVKEIIPTIE